MAKNECEPWCMWNFTSDKLLGGHCKNFSVFMYADFQGVGLGGSVFLLMPQSSSVVFSVCCLKWFLLEHGNLSQGNNRTHSSIILFCCLWYLSFAFLIELAHLLPCNVCIHSADLFIWMWKGRRHVSKVNNWLCVMLFEVSLLWRSIRKTLSGCRDYFVLVPQLAT